MATQKDVADHLDLGDRRLRDLIQDGVIAKPTTRNNWDVDHARTSYIRYLRARAAGHMSEGGIDLVEQKSLESKERTEKLSLENRVTRGELIDWQEIEPLLTKYLVALRNRLRASASKIRAKVPKLTKTALGDIREIHNEILIEFSDDILALCPDEPEPGSSESSKAATE